MEDMWAEKKRKSKEMLNLSDVPQNKTQPHGARSDYVQ